MMLKYKKSNLFMHEVFKFIIFKVEKKEKKQYYLIIIVSYLMICLFIHQSQN